MVFYPLMTETVDLTDKLTQGQKPIIGIIAVLEDGDCIVMDSDDQCDLFVDGVYGEDNCIIHNFDMGVYKVEFLPQLIKSTYPNGGCEGDFEIDVELIEVLWKHQTE